MSEPQHVFTSDGRHGIIIIDDSNPSRHDPRFVEVRMEDGAILHVPAELLELRPDGAFSLQVGMADIEGQTTGTTGADRSDVSYGHAVGADRSSEASGHARASEASDHVSGGRRLVLPVVAEELEVGRRAVTTGVVRVQKHVREREELVDETVTREDVQVERVPVGRLVDAPPAMRSEGDTLVIPVLEEVLVVEKRLRLKEEVRVTWRRVVEPAPERVVLRDEEVVIERLPPDTGGAAGDPTST